MTSLRIVFLQATARIQTSMDNMMKFKGVIGVIATTADGVPLRSTLEQTKTIQYCTEIIPLCHKAKLSVKSISAEVC
jgi:hypothetical protein